MSINKLIITWLEICFFWSPSKQVYYNIFSRPVKEFVQIQYIGEFQPHLSNNFQNFEISQVQCQLFSPSKIGKNERSFRAMNSNMSSSGQLKIFLLVYAIKANIEYELSNNKNMSQEFIFKFEDTNRKVCGLCQCVNTC